MDENHRPYDFLLIGGSFFGYARKIIENIEARGRRVLWFDDRPSTGALGKAALRVAPSSMAIQLRRHAAAIVALARKHAIRDVLVIKGEGIGRGAIDDLRGALQDARFTLYFWDSYRNMPKDSDRKVPLFDRVFTFDPVDAARDARLRYRPLFYLDEYAALPRAHQDIDLLFYGTAHTDRYRILRKLAASLPPQVRFEKVLYFPSPAIYVSRRAVDPRMWGARRCEFTFTPVSSAGIRDLVSRAGAIVDIERTVQSGWTMRSVEALGAGRKLVTTNAAITGAEFYHPDNIAVLDRRRPVLPADFFDKPYVEPSQALLRRYSLSGWVDEMLGDSSDSQHVQ